MKKEDLYCGNIVELREGNKFIVIVKFADLNFDLVSVNGNLLGKLSRFNENLEYFGNHNFDIIKVYEDYTLKKVLWERKEFVVSTDEKTILRILPKQFKWIVRSQEKFLLLYEEKPQKTRYYWESSLGNVENLMAFNHLFEYIKWEDELPTLIEDLLKN